jgi:hypothetical protein
MGHKVRVRAEPCAQRGLPEGVACTLVIAAVEDQIIQHRCC